MSRKNSDELASLEDVSLTVSSYKCFGSGQFGYDRIFPINLIIGRNNTGKSTLLDLLSYATAPRDFRTLGHKGEQPHLYISDTLMETELRRTFEENAISTALRGFSNNWQFGRSWLGKRITVEIDHDGNTLFGSINPPFRPEDVGGLDGRLAREKGNPFSGYRFKRLLADRDIVREDEADSLDIQSNGQGVTNLIRNYLVRADLPATLVEETLLGALNSIFEPDGHIRRIIVQQVGGKGTSWELYFDEEGKGWVPLAHTGSGLKTILLVLTYLYLVPHVEKKPLNRYLFGFEELENNLHPALLRRLLLYLRGVAMQKGCRFFLTTHSSATIDLFSSDERAQILHVTHDGSCASVKAVTTYVDNKGVLDDLDVRASDLLQANGIVWVEGPSDRLYFNRWVELWTDGALREGAHYQCVFYGGRLLAHLSAADPDVDADDVVKILRVNRNAILLMDSDRRHSVQEIGQTKRRMVEEIESIGGLAWVTEGKEIENYIPGSAVALHYGRDTAPPLGRYMNFSTYLDKIINDAGKKFLRKKVLFADRVCPHLTKENMMGQMDWSEKMSAVCSMIAKWNGTLGD